MKIFRKVSRFILIAILCVCWMVMPVYGEETETDVICDGVYVDEVSLGGKTEAEAYVLVEDYVAELAEKRVTLMVSEDQIITVSLADMGFAWNNPEVVAEALSLGRRGNVIQRYKVLKDLENADKEFPLHFTLDTALISDVITEQCEIYNQPAVNATMTRTDGVVNVTEGQEGRVIDTRASVDIIYNYIQNEWDKEDCTIQLAVITEEPKGSAEELKQLTDILGTFTTAYTTSGSSRSANVINGCALINGTCLYPGEEFSTYDTVSPFSVDNGYYLAGSYENGQVVDSLGGGICQVSTTLYNVVLRAELEVTERYNHSMIVTYVDPSADAAIAESAGKDFKFINNTEHPIYIEGITTPDKHITFTIYGIESRSANRTVEYVSEVLSTQVPENEVIFQDAGQPVGFISVQSAHIGQSARLWKVISEGSAEVSREEVNSSYYMASPRSATVGTATDDPVILEHLLAAISTNNIDHVKNMIGILLPPPPAEGEQSPVPGPGEAVQPPAPDPGEAVPPPAIEVPEP